MNEMPLPGKKTVPARLLGGWRDVLDDLRLLCRTLQGLPEVCECGHGPAHLKDGCPCCGTSATTRVPKCDACGAQLAALRPSIDTLSVDALRFLPIVKELLDRDDAAAGAQVRAIERSIRTLVGSFDQLVVAAARFTDDCRMSHLNTLKSSAAALREDAENLNRLVCPEPEPWMSRAGRGGRGRGEG